jgi:hypothetical protein
MPHEGLIDFLVAPQPAELPIVNCKYRQGLQGNDAT